MFDFVHENKWLIQIILALVVLSLGFWGVSSYDKAGKSATMVATVNGTKITQQEFEHALRLGANFDATMFDNPEMKRAVLENLVAQRLLVERAKAAGLFVSDDQVQQKILFDLAGAGLLNDGSFDKQRYEAALSEKGMTSAMHEDLVRKNLTSSQLTDAYTRNGYASNSVVDNVISLNEQQWMVSVLPVSFQPFMAQAKVDEAALKKYYEQNQKEFQVQEQARVEYVRFSVDNLLAKAEVKTEDARKYYDEHQGDFGTPEERQAAHKPARLLPFSEAREGIINKLRQQKAADLFAELAEKFSNTVYEQSDTLKPAADLAGAKIEQSGWLIKGEAAGDPWTAKMLQAIFTDEVVKNKRNTAAIEVAANTLVAARILEYKPAATRALNEVQEMIRQKLLRQQAMELAARQGKTLLEQLQRGDKPALNWTAAQTVTRAQQGLLDKELVRKIFQADAAKLPQYAGAETPQNGYLLVRIEAVKEGGKPDDAKRAGYAQKLRQLTGEEMKQAYICEAKRQATLEVNLPEMTKEMLRMYNCNAKQ